MKSSELRVIRGFNDAHHRLFDGHMRNRKIMNTLFATVAVCTVIALLNRPTKVQVTSK